MMPIYLTQAQIDQITALKNAGPNAQGNYSHIYKFIGDLLSASDEKNWFRGAEQANAGQGVYSAMIRAYSQRQMELRGIVYSREKQRKGARLAAEKRGQAQFMIDMRSCHAALAYTFRAFLCT